MCLLRVNLNSMAVPGVFFPSTLAYCTSTASDSEEDLDSLLEWLDSSLGELSSLGEAFVEGGRLQDPSHFLMVLTAVSQPSGLMPALASGLSGFLEVSSLGIPGVSSTATATSGSLEELISLLERLNSVLGELDSLWEVLGAEGLSGGFIAASDWDEGLNSLLETLDSFREEQPTSPWKVLDSLGILFLLVPLDSQGEGGLPG